MASSKNSLEAEILRIQDHMKSEMVKSQYKKIELLGQYYLDRPVWMELICISQSGETVFRDLPADLKSSVQNFLEAKSKNEQSPANLHIVLDSSGISKIQLATVQERIDQEKAEYINSLSQESLGDSFANRVIAFLNKHEKMQPDIHSRDDSHHIMIWRDGTGHYYLGLICQYDTSPQVSKTFSKESEFRKWLAEQSDRSFFENQIRLSRSILESLLR